MKGLDKVREMKVIKFTITLLSTSILFLLFFPKKSINPSSSPQPLQRDSSSSSMSRARSFVLWLHGLGDSGPANEPIKTLFTSPEFRDTKWSFPSAPSAPVTCNCTSSLLYLFKRSPMFCSNFNPIATNIHSPNSTLSCSDFCSFLTVTGQSLSYQFRFLGDLSLREFKEMIRYP